MSTTDTIKTAMAAIERGDFNAVASYLTDDLVFAGPVPEPMGKREFIGVQSALVAALPDWKFNASELREQGDKVTVNVHITGTHTGTLNPPMPGIPVLPPSGKHVSLPNETITFTVRGDKISRLDVTSVPGGGVPGVLSQLGVKLPIMPM